MAIGIPQLPRGVRPVVGDHLTPQYLSRTQREWRTAANLAAVARRRVSGTGALPAAPPYPKLFVVGCGRSGTTWVQNILGMHPKVVSSSESHAYETIFEPIATRGRRSVRAWAKVLHRHDLSEREARWVGLHWWVNRATLLDFIGWALAANDVDDAGAAERVIQAVFDSYFLEAGGDAHHTLLEKTPGHLRYAARILRHFPEARIVEVVRDGRDVCVSLEMQALTADWVPTERRRQIAMWAQAVRRGRELRADASTADRVMTVRYEDLKADPPARIAELLAFARLDASPELVETIASATDFRRHRGDTGPGRHYRKGEVGDWRNHFSADDEALFRELAGAEFEAAGYRFD